MLVLGLCNKIWQLSTLSWLTIGNLLVNHYLAPKGEGVRRLNLGQARNGSTGQRSAFMGESWLGGRLVPRLNELLGHGRVSS